MTHSRYHGKGIGILWFESTTRNVTLGLSNPFVTRVLTEMSMTPIYGLDCLG